jgi:hypothetical protein
MENGVRTLKSAVISGVLAVTVALLAGCAPAMMKVDKPEIADVKKPPADYSKVESLDLEVQGIYGPTCPACNLSKIDAFLMGTIQVQVREKMVAGTYKNPDFEILVTYFDLSAGSQQQVTRQGKFQHGGVTEKVMVVNHPVMARKSFGIKAEVAPKSPPGIFYKDINPNDNLLSVYDCYNQPLE